MISFVMMSIFNGALIFLMLICNKLVIDDNETNKHDKSNIFKDWHCSCSLTPAAVTWDVKGLQASKKTKKFYKKNII